MNMMDLLKILVNQEQESRIIQDRARYLAREGVANGNNHFDSNPWRQMIVEWYYSIVDRIGADRELVYITMNILDRFVDVKTFYLKDKKEYEKAVIASLLISSKLYADEYICPREIIQLASSSITTKSIMATTVEIYESLSWDFCIPTAARFAHTFVKCISENPSALDRRNRSEIFEDAIFQIELSVQDSVCSSQPPSLVAWMAVENAIEATNTDVSLEDLKNFRSQVSKITGHQYSVELRSRLRGFKVNLIASDNSEHFYQAPPLKPRPLKDIPVVSMNDMKSL